MKRQITDNETRVYAYGIGHILSGLEHAYAEQERNRALWDKLVDIDRMHDVAILAAASADDDRLVVLRDEIYFAGLALSEAIETRAKERKRTKSNQVAHSLDDAVTHAVVRLKTARNEFYQRLGAWKRANPDAMREFSATRFAEIKKTRQIASSGSVDAWQLKQRIAELKNERERLLEQVRD